MAVIDITNRLNKGNNRIAYVGLEMEGGWQPRPAGIKITHDGSVFCNGAPTGFKADKSPSNRNFGEVVSNVMEPIGIPVWMKRFYPTHHDITCGLHVHMSFKTAEYYVALMDKDFQDTLIHHLELWGKENNIPADHTFWARLAGKNRYCLSEFFANEQALQRSKSFDTARGHRYTMLNYCYGLHGTIECRVLPIFPNVMLAIGAVRKVLDVTNAVLAVKFGRKREKMVEEVVFPPEGDFSEEVDQETI